MIREGIAGLVLTRDGSRMPYENYSAKAWSAVTGVFVWQPKHHELYWMYGVKWR